MPRNGLFSGDLLDDASIDEILDAQVALWAYHLLPAHEDPAYLAGRQRLLEPGVGVAYHIREYRRLHQDRDTKEADIFYKTAVHEYVYDTRSLDILDI